MRSCIFVDTSPESEEPNTSLKAETIVPEWVAAYCLEPIKGPRWACMQRAYHQESEDEEESPEEKSLEDESLEDEKPKDEEPEEESPIQIVSICLDKVERKNGKVDGFQIGISILDTEALGADLSSTPSKQTNWAARVIQSHHWIIEDAKYSIYKDSTFRFGTGRYVALADLGKDLKGIVEDDNFVLVTHGQNQVLSVLKELDISLNPLYTIDTAKVSQNILRLSEPLSLYNVLCQLGLVKQPLHLAGNEAHLTIRALLMLVSKDSKTQLFHDHSEVQRWMTMLYDIGMSSVQKRRSSKTAKNNAQG
ncbi:hypothetical protein F53441_10621 [Fusarium austroafricanum]|uniref:Gfd2/YDR514C-like C-terminal domain-containing protein n=1 Tax=Fusarium austroafricanum TaxID=2364996 RepID=A0A8H4K6K4_9HYPO|nr:hypothetical protein F53441_10621 [Fusarium austroafricanum]